MKSKYCTAEWVPASAYFDPTCNYLLNKFRAMAREQKKAKAEAEKKPANVRPLKKGQQ